MRAALLFALWAWAAAEAPAQMVEITQKAGGYRVTRGGAEISTHATERKAWQAALNAGPGTYLVYPPPLEIVVKPPVVVSSVEGKSPVAYYPACVTSDCRGPTHAERLAARAKIAANTAAWVALPEHRLRMGWHASMWDPRR